jgi:ribosomal protein L12E/L44/L45/RPP1/RPP2
MPIKDAMVVKVRDDMHNLVRCLASIRNLDIRTVVEEMVEQRVAATPGGSIMLARAREKAAAAKAAADKMKRKAAPGPPRGAS